MWLFGALAAVVLTLQLAHPFHVRAPLPAWLNWFCLACASGSWGLWLAHGSGVERWAAGACWGALGYVLWFTDGFQQPSLEHLGSVLCAELSRTVLSVPLPGVLCAWSVLAAAWLLGESTRVGLGPRCPARVLLIVRVASALLAWFGVLAIVGYATGSPDLLP